MARASNPIAWRDARRLPRTTTSHLDHPHPSFPIPPELPPSQEISLPDPLLCSLLVPRLSALICRRVPHRAL
jgi:hypothetical protein